MHQHCNSVDSVGALKDLKDFLHEPSNPRKAKAKQALLRDLKVTSLHVILHGYRIQTSQIWWHSIIFLTSVLNFTKMNLKIHHSVIIA